MGNFYYGCLEYLEFEMILRIDLHVFLVIKLVGGPTNRIERNYTA